MKHLPATALALLLATPIAGQTFTEPPTAVDLDPSPGVFETNLVASETTWEYVTGVQTPVWAYNGSIPGPTIQVNIGQRIKINFTNNLPDPTTIHWHGIESPAVVDGSHISQNPIPPGGTHTYEWTAINEGMHWYHPHVRTNDQVEKGLHGVIILRNPTGEELLGLNQFEEHILVFDDVLLDQNNLLVPAFSFTDPLQNAVYHLNGREGNLLLLNGKPANQMLTVTNGQPQRFRILNVANTTFARLDFRDTDDGLDEGLWQIGSDQGLVSRPYLTYDLTPTIGPPLDNTVAAADPGSDRPDEGGLDHPGQSLINQMGQGAFLMPGERMDMVITPIGNDGQVFTVYQNDWYRGRHTASLSTSGAIVLGQDPMDGLYPKQPYLQITTQGPDPGTGEVVLPATLREFPAPIPHKGTLPFMFGHGNPDPVTGAVTLFAQAEMVSGMLSPLPTPKITSFKAHDIEIGDTWLWEVINLSHGEHPFHTHGFRFELVEYEFQDMLDPTNNFFFMPTERRMWKDTIRVPPRLGAKGTSKSIARLRVTFTDTGRTENGGVVAHGALPTFDGAGSFTSGGWLAHCHILEHSAKGMLSYFEVRDPADPFHLLGFSHPGTKGKPSLTASGDLSPGSDVTYTLVNGPPSQTVWILGGNIAANRPFFGGTVVPGVTRDGVTVAPSPLFGVSIPVTTNANGEVSFSSPGWATPPSGSKLYAQAVFKDAGASQGWSYSNAVLFTTP